MSTVGVAILLGELPVVTAWLALAAWSFATGTPAPAFLNYSNRNAYGCCKPTVVGDTWLRICGEVSSTGYTLPLIYSSETSRLPISLTVSALDYYEDVCDRDGGGLDRRTIGSPYYFWCAWTLSLVWILADLRGVYSTRLDPQ